VEDCLSSSHQRLRHSRRKTRHQLLRTLLFMPVVKQFKPYDLRSYSGDALALLSGRKRAFGYIHTERFLSQLACSSQFATVLTKTMAKWTAELWQHNEEICYYVDSHRKAVYSDVRLPRGLIGRTGQILGCRVLTLLHDEEGHPLLVQTDRGDQHLTRTLPEVVKTYEQVDIAKHPRTIVVDREGMSADFLDKMAPEYTVVTLLRANQYQGIDDFDELESFEPLMLGTEGQILSEVAAARYRLKLSEGKERELYVALIRDHRHLVPKPKRKSWREEMNNEQLWVGWGDPDWEPSPIPSALLEPKLIAIVSTSPFEHPTELVQIYKNRWVAQENSIKDFLIPLGIDSNRGYAKTEVVNSEIAKRQSAIEQKLVRLKAWQEGAQRRSQRAGRRYDRLYQQLKTEHTQMNAHLSSLVGTAEYDSYLEEINVEIKKRQREIYKVYRLSNDEYMKAHGYAKKRCEVLRDLEDLKAREQPMYLLDNRKDQIMSLLIIGLTNLVMWIRDRFFPLSCAQATWKRLCNFLQLPGWIHWTEESCEVRLRRFNDTALNRELELLCQQVTKDAPRLPDGRIIVLINE